MSLHTTLPVHHVPDQVALAIPRNPRSLMLDLNAPALEAMTDFSCDPPISIHEHARLDQALGRMMDADARLAFVRTESGALAGVITTGDIQGDKPIHFLQSLDCNHHTCSWHDIVVRDIMTPVPEWRAARLSSLSRARVGDVVATLNALGQRYLLVIDERAAAHETPLLRGVFLSWQLQTYLDFAIDAEHPSGTFLEIERAIAHT